MARIAIVGAGVSGLVAARNLQPRHEVVVFDKSRGAGGRLATRYADPYRFDHGAQYFTARSAGFRAFLEPLIKRGVIEHWPATCVELCRNTLTTTRAWNDGQPRYVGVPGMNAASKTLARTMDVRLNSQVGGIARSGAHWRVIDSEGDNLGHYDAVVLAVPAAQCAALAPAGSELRRLSENVSMNACFTLMLGYKAPLELEWQAAFVRGADISWVAVNSSKPGRAKPFTLVVHSTNTYADAHLEDDQDTVLEHLLTETSRVLDTSWRHPEHIRLHRWRYANIEKQSGPTCFLDSDTNLAACGDWFTRGRVEAAFTSGNDLSAALLASL